MAPISFLTRSDGLKKSLDSRGWWRAKICQNQALQHVILFEASCGVCAVQEQKLGPLYFGCPIVSELFLSMLVPTRGLFVCVAFESQEPKALGAFGRKVAERDRADSACLSLVALVWNRYDLFVKPQVGEPTYGGLGVH